MRIIRGRKKCSSIKYFSRVKHYHVFNVQHFTVNFHAQNDLVKLVQFNKFERTLPRLHCFPSWNFHNPLKSFWTQSVPSIRSVIYLKIHTFVITYNAKFCFISVHNGWYSTHINRKLFFSLITTNLIYFTNVLKFVRNNVKKNF